MRTSPCTSPTVAYPLFGRSTQCFQRGARSVDTAGVEEDLRRRCVLLDQVAAPTSVVAVAVLVERHVLHRCALFVADHTERLAAVRTLRLVLVDSDSVLVLERLDVLRVRGAVGQHTQRQRLVDGDADFGVLILVDQPVVGRFGGNREPIGPLAGFECDLGDLRFGVGRRRFVQIGLLDKIGNLLDAHPIDRVAILQDIACQIIDTFCPCFFNLL